MGDKDKAHAEKTGGYGPKGNRKAAPWSDAALSGRGGYEVDPPRPKPQVSAREKAAQSLGRPKPGWTNNVMPREAREMNQAVANSMRPPSTEHAWQVREGLNQRGLPDKNSRLGTRKAVRGGRR